MRCVYGGSKALLAAPWGWNCHLQRESEGKASPSSLQGGGAMRAQGQRQWVQVLVCTTVPRMATRYLGTCLSAYVMGTTTGQVSMYRGTTQPPALHRGRRQIQTRINAGGQLVSMPITFEYES